MIRFGVTIAPSGAGGDFTPQETILSAEAGLRSYEPLDDGIAATHKAMMRVTNDGEHPVNGPIYIGFDNFSPLGTELMNPDVGGPPELPQKRVLDEAGVLLPDAYTDWVWVEWRVPLSDVGQSLGDQGDLEIACDGELPLEPLSLGGLLAEGEVVDPQRGHRRQGDEELEVFLRKLPHGRVGSQDDETEGRVGRVQRRREQRPNTGRDQAFGLGEPVVGPGIGDKCGHGLADDLRKEALGVERSETGVRGRTAGDAGELGARR